MWGSNSIKAFCDLFSFKIPSCDCVNILRETIKNAKKSLLVDLNLFALLKRLTFLYKDFKGIYKAAAEVKGLTYFQKGSKQWKFPGSYKMVEMVIYFKTHEFMKWLQPYENVQPAPENFCLNLSKVACLLFAKSSVCWNPIIYLVLNPQVTRFHYKLQCNCSFLSFSPSSRLCLVDLFPRCKHVLHHIPALKIWAIFLFWRNNPKEFFIYNLRIVRCSVARCLSCAANKDWLESVQ